MALTQEQLEAAVTALQAKEGAAPLEFAAKIYGQNLLLQEENKNIKNGLSEIKAKVPAEGSVVLAGDDAKAWEAFKGLGRPDEVKTQLEAAKTATAELAKVERSRLAARAAKTVGYDPDVLEDLLPKFGDGAVLEVKSEQKEGKAADVAYVKDASGSTELSKFVEEKLPKYLPSLKTSGQSSGSGEKGGTKWPSQDSAGKTTKNDPAGSYIQKMYGPKVKT